jgi:hypothetical protein
LNEVVYAPLRLLGAEPLLALSLTAVGLSAVAYFFLYLFLRRFGVSALIASLAAFIFTFANNLYLSSYHFQLFAVYYIPIIGYCAQIAVSDVHQRPTRAYLVGALGAGLYGLLFSTGYYMAWFFSLALLIFTPITIAFAWPQVLSWWHRRPSRVFVLGLVVSVTFLGALSIFLIIYVPVLATGAVRTFGEYLVYAPSPIDIINVGMKNFIWSGVIQSLRLIGGDHLDNIEVSLALTPIVQILLLSSVILAFRPRFWPDSETGRIARAFALAAASVCVLFYFLVIKVGNLSLFRVIYAIVPGATAIRVGDRGMVVANLFAVTAIGLTVDRLIRRFFKLSRPLMRVGGLAALMVLLSLGTIEQLNLSQTAYLSRKFEREHISALGAAPRACRAFYLVSPANREVELQPEAMMIALDQHIPTINGYSGLSPPGWNLDDPNLTDYEQEAVGWTARRGIVEGLCRADIGNRTWTVVDMRDWACGHGGCVRRISFDQIPEFEINLAKGGNGAFFTDSNWAGAEYWGQWTRATQATLSFSVGAPRDLVLALSIGPLLSATAPKQSVWVEANQCRVGGVDFGWAHGSGTKTISGTIPAGCIAPDGSVTLRINTDRVRSPKEIGINDDERKLGVAVERVQIKQDN